VKGLSYSGGREIVVEIGQPTQKLSRPTPFSKMPVVQATQEVKIGEYSLRPVWEELV
jgi:hypothetical protein